MDASPASSPSRHGDFTIVSAYPRVLDEYLSLFEGEKFGLAQITAFKVSYSKSRDIYRARIDTKMRAPSPSRGDAASTLLLFQTDYIELRGAFGTVQHIGTREDPEVSRGSGLSGKVAHWPDFTDWACWIDEQ